MSASSGDTAGVGSTADMVRRMRTVLPAAWFPMTSPDAVSSATPVMDGLLSGSGWAWSYCHALAGYVIQQTRIATATAGLLDMICSDFFGVLLKRRAGEADDAFRNRIQANLLIPRATRAALSNALLTLLARQPMIFEPGRAADTGGYGSPTITLGSGGMAFQYLVTVSSGAGWTIRESEASFIDESGAMRIAQRHVVRHLYVAGVAQGPLLEGRGFNLIKDSAGWSACLPASAGAAMQWVVDDGGTGALLNGQPQLDIAIVAGGILAGPSMSASADAEPVTGSAWVMLPPGHTITTLGLRITDLADPAYVATQMCDPTIVGRWQRITATLSTSGQAGRRVTIVLVGTASGAMKTVMLTQCWQIEPGAVATSYIPSSFQVGIREADGPVSAENAESSAVDARGLYEAVGRAAPAGSIAWTAILG
ncbi:MAG: phage head spike fiber domain-containing protein [Janthinobacterium lividum]